MTQWREGGNKERWASAQQESSPVTSCPTVPRPRAGHGAGRPPAEREPRSDRESGWWPPQGPLCQAAREAGRGAGAGSAHTQRPHDTRPPAAGGGGGGPGHSLPLRGREVPADVLSGTLRLGGRLSRAVPEPSGLLGATSPLPSSLSEVALAAQHRPPRSLYTGKRGRCYTSGLFSFFSRKLAVKCFPAQWWVRAKR